MPYQLNSGLTFGRYQKQEVFCLFKKINENVTSGSTNICILLITPVGSFIQCIMSSQLQITCRRHDRSLFWKLPNNMKRSFMNAVRLLHVLDVSAPPYIHQQSHALDLLLKGIICNYGSLFYLLTFWQKRQTSTNDYHHQFQMNA